MLLHDSDNPKRISKLRFWGKNAESMESVSYQHSCNNADSWQGSFLFPAFYRRGLFGLVLLRLPQCVTADVELQDDAVMY